jgi:hypothetical protein
MNEVINATEIAPTRTALISMRLSLVDFDSKTYFRPSKIYSRAAYLAATTSISTTAPLGSADT